MFARNLLDTSSSANQGGQVAIYRQLRLINLAFLHLAIDSHSGLIQEIDILNYLLMASIPRQVQLHWLQL